MTTLTEIEVAADALPPAQKQELFRFLAARLCDGSAQRVAAGGATMNDESLPSIEYEGVHCSITIRRPAPGVAVIVLSGSDVGEFGGLPMRELQKDLACFDTIELFIDARAVRGATIEVSAEWALWMRAHRTSFKRINMLTGSRYIQITAAFVRRFAGLADLMNVFTEHKAFEECLAGSVCRIEAALQECRRQA